MVSDNYRKIYPIKENLYFGITGIYEKGLDILNLIKRIKWDSRIELVKKSLSCFDNYCICRKLQKMTMVIAGKDEEGLFILQRNILGDELDVNFIEGSEGIKFAFNGPDNTKDLEKYLKDKIISGQTVKNSIIETIGYASTVNNSISREYDFYEIDNP